jgi:hypothetical protein
MKLKIKIKIKGLILMICSYCEVIYGVKPSMGGSSGFSHGICKSCHKQIFAGGAKGKLNNNYRSDKQKCGVQPAFII